MVVSVQMQESHTWQRSIILWPWETTGGAVCVVELWGLDLVVMFHSVNNMKLPVYITVSHYPVVLELPSLPQTFHSTLSVCFANLALFYAALAIVTYVSSWLGEQELDEGHLWTPFITGSSIHVASSQRLFRKWINEHLFNNPQMLPIFISNLQSRQSMQIGKEVVKLSLVWLCAVCRKSHGIWE